MRTLRLSLIGTVSLVLLGGPGAAGQSEEPDAMAFPTGTFVATEWSDRFVEFREDGTCFWALTPGYQDFECTFVIDGDLLTETSREDEYIFTDSYEPLTYRWDYDGEHLTFQPHPDDDNPGRAMYVEQPYRYVPDPRVVVIADFDIAAGTELLSGHTDLRVVPGADVPEATFADQDLVTGRVASVPVSEGQPITPDLLEPPAE